MPTASNVPADLANLWSFLLERYTGAENGATRTAILARYNLMHKSELTDRAFRQQVSDLVTIHKKPVCTSASGLYFVARTSAEKAIAEHYLESVISSVAERLRALKEADPPERQERLF